MDRMLSLEERKIYEITIPLKNASNQMQLIKKFMGSDQETMHWIFQCNEDDFNQYWNFLECDEIISEDTFDQDDNQDWMEVKLLWNRRPHNTVHLWFSFDLVS